MNYLDGKGVGEEQLERKKTSDKGRDEIEKVAFRAEGRKEKRRGGNEKRERIEKI